MASINRSRLHFLLSCLYVLAGEGIGIYFLHEEYPSYWKRFVRQQEIQNLEQRTGKTYEQWEEMQTAICTKEKDKRKPRNVQEWGDSEREYSFSMSVPFVSVIPSRIESMPTFLLERGHWILSFPLFFVFQAFGIMPPTSAHAEC